MLGDLRWKSADAMARKQFQLYRAVGEQMRLSDADARRVLLLSESQWTAWSGFMADGQLPAEPPLPVMLRRLGSATWRLASLAERQRAVI